MRFLPPCQPKLRKDPPRGPLWLHEVKFDGYRVQLHKPTVIYSKNGKDFTARFPSIAEAVGKLPCTSAVIDGELIVPDEQGRPDFFSLHLKKSRRLIVWCFDLLELDGEDLMTLPLSERRAQLKGLLRRKSQLLWYSEAFSDPDALLSVCGEQGLEGIVSKRSDLPYRSGRCDWVKVKCPKWKERHKDRRNLFEKP